MNIHTAYSIHHFCDIYARFVIADLNFQFHNPMMYLRIKIGDPVRECGYKTLVCQLTNNYCTALSKVCYLH